MVDHLPTYLPVPTIILKYPCIMIINFAITSLLEVAIKCLIVATLPLHWFGQRVRPFITIHRLKHATKGSHASRKINRKGSTGPP